MKYAEFNIENHKIEFMNSVFGIEKVLLDGKTVSEKFSFSGIKHKLNLNSENFILKSKYKQFDKREIELELVKNGKTIEKQTVQADKKQRIYWMLIGTGLGIGAYELLNLIIESLN
ncbi:hypothetical protein BST83_06275 [Polaribacter filamentus]|uniref:Uncharacterized protein n=1 Tax=Polaribacter filamentus TaxID=53483 RepID=A0A2S7KW31_9FLAO|nr:hypothetical protein [Polaribacter filamentus]PQB06806.1 hypothetical protein BST83_06275 [Polaribacter filamentus]